MSSFANPVRTACAHRWIRAVAVGACIAAGAGGSGFTQTASAQAGDNVPAFVSSPSTLGWVRVREDGRNALYGDGWLDPPAGLRGPIGSHPDHPLQGNTGRGAGRQVTVAIGNYHGPDPQALGGRANAAIERGGAFR